MNDRVSEELLAEAAGRATVRITASMSIITAKYKGNGYSFRADGWFNATGAAKRYGKEPSDWISQKETRLYIEALDRTYRLGRYVETSRARSDRGGGTWLHPKLAVKFARWLDVDFEIWCDMQIDQILARRFSAGEPQRLSSFKQRRPLYDSALDMVGASGMLFGEAYRIINAVAGTHHMDEITMEKLEATIPPIQRLGDGTATPQDFARVDKGMIEIYGLSAQLLLGFGENSPEG